MWVYRFVVVVAATAAATVIIAIIIRIIVNVIIRCTMSNHQIVDFGELYGFSFGQCVDISPSHI